MSRACRIARTNLAVFPAAVALADRASIGARAGAFPSARAAKAKPEKIGVHGMIGTWLRALARVGRERQTFSVMSARWHAVVLVAIAASASASSPPPLSPPGFPLLSEGSVTSIARLPDGDVVVAGSFISINGSPRDDIARFADDGTLQSPGATESLTENPRVVAVDTAGDFYVAGGARRHVHVPRPEVRRRDGPCRVGLVVQHGRWRLARDHNWRERSRLCRRHVHDGQRHCAPSHRQARRHHRRPRCELESERRRSGVRARGRRRRLDLRRRRFRDDRRTDALAHREARGHRHGRGRCVVESDREQHRVRARARCGDVALRRRRVHVDRWTVALALAKLAAAGTGGADATWNPARTATCARSHSIRPAPSTRAAISRTSAAASHQRLVKLSPTGAGGAIASWNASASDTVYALTFDASDNLYVGGEFALIDGETRLALAKLAPNGSVAGLLGRRRGRRLRIRIHGAAGRQHDRRRQLPQGRAGRALEPLAPLPDRTLDPAFAPIADDEVDALLATPDGSIYAGGLFLTIDGVARNRLAKLGSGGAVDPAWNPRRARRSPRLRARPTVRSMPRAASRSSAACRARASRSSRRAAVARSIRAGMRRSTTSCARSRSRRRLGLVGGDFMHAGGSRAKPARQDQWFDGRDRSVVEPVRRLVRLLARTRQRRALCRRRVLDDRRPDAASIARLSASGTGAADAASTRRRAAPSSRSASMPTATSTPAAATA